MKKRQARVFVAVSIAAGSLIAATTGCSDSNALTEPHLAVSPTPPPAADLSGAWSGTFRRPQNSYNGCSLVTGATATFTQTGSMVKGPLSGGNCFYGVSITGVLRGTALKGTYLGEINEYPNGTAEGTFLGGNLTIRIEKDRRHIGDITLHR